MSSFFRSKPSSASNSSSAASSLRGAASSPARVKHALSSPELKVPLAGSKPARSTEELSHLELYDEMLSHYSAEGFEVPSGLSDKGVEVEGGRLGRGERMWLTEECFWRYVIQSLPGTTTPPLSGC